MGIIPINTAEFMISFDYVAGSSYDHGQQIDALKQALHIAPAYRGYCDTTLWSDRHIIKGARYTGHLRINKLKRTPGRHQTTYAILYSFFLCDAQGDIKGWSGDLDETSPLKPLALWFRADDGPLEPTEALITAIKALIPKKPRAKKAP